MQMQQIRERIASDYRTVRHPDVGQRLEDAQALLAENDRLRAALKVADEAINPPDRGGLSLDKWNERLKAATIIIREASSTTCSRCGQNLGAEGCADILCPFPSAMRTSDR